MKINKDCEIKNVSSKLMDIRKKKLYEFSQKRKLQYYPNNFVPNTNIVKLRSRYEASGREDLNTISQVEKHSIAGRIILRRIMGRSSFITLRDEQGKIQVYLNSKILGQDNYEDFKKYYDIGDIIGVIGFIFKTKTKELSLYAHKIELVTKSIRPLPEKFHGLNSLELKYRKRYLDLMINEDTRKVFQTRSEIIKFIRYYFSNNLGFTEVETPMMHNIPGGATANPFKTYHNSLDMPLFLRIAPELFLKKLVVGGFEKVFEINRNFRNEGLSSHHNPEFTTIEFYQAYSNFKDLMCLTENLLRNLCQHIMKTTQINYRGFEIDFSLPFQKIDMVQSILQYSPSLCLKDLITVENAVKVAIDLEIDIDPDSSIGIIQSKIFENVVEKKLIHPTFITGYPTEISPLARPNNLNPLVTDRFELFIAGFEIANGFSELNDPSVQRENFVQQFHDKNISDYQQHIDFEYIEALEYGLPPTAGEGIGLDRLVMLLTNQESIKDVILFPQMRRVL